MNFRERQQLGLDVLGLRSVVQRLKDSGQIDRDTSPAEAAALVLGELQANNSQKFAGPGLDIERILRWLELIMPVIFSLLKIS